MKLVSKRTFSPLLWCSLSLFCMSGLQASHEWDQESAQGTRTYADPMMRGNTVNTCQGWSVIPLVTVGEKKGEHYRFNQDTFGYDPIGIFDGIGTFVVNERIMRTYVNHEASASDGTPYLLKNGTRLTGARVDAWDIDRKCLTVIRGDVGYEAIIDREGIEVTDASQLNKGREASAAFAPSEYVGGFTRFCSGRAIDPKTTPFRDRMYLAPEELAQGQLNFIDVAHNTCYVTPMLGQHWFENAAPLENYHSNKVLLIFGEDVKPYPGPLWLYIGELGKSPPQNATYQPPEFLVRNGLGYGRLYAWVADDPNIRTGSDFQGTGNTASGKFKLVPHYIPLKEGQIPPPDFDSLGFLRGETYEEFTKGQYGPLISAAFDRGAFQFQRMEDLHENPYCPSLSVFSATGGENEENPYGRLYILDLDHSAADILAKPIDCITELKANLRILYDAADSGGGQFPTPFDGIRSADNVVWSKDGYVYVQEDITSSSFCANGKAPSMWQINPHTSKATRILEMDYSAVPNGQIDTSSACNRWESSGVIDVSDQLWNPCHRTMLLFDVQAATITEPQPPFEAKGGLIEGSQLILAIGPEKTDSESGCHCDENVELDP